MHQTTVRFGPDLWQALEEECSRLGVSAAQFLREAAVARLSYTAGRRHELEYEHALADAGVTAEGSESGDAGAPAGTAVVAQARPVRAVSSAQTAAVAAAVSAQSQQVWRRARRLREAAVELRQRREMVK